MHTKSIGEITEGSVIAALIKSGASILIPFGENRRYDIVMDWHGTFYRVQCKTGMLLKDRGVIQFACCSCGNGRNPVRKHYQGQIEFFGVYCPQTEDVFLVPVEDAAKTYTVIRVGPRKSNLVRRGIREAEQYRISGHGSATVLAALAMRKQVGG